MNSFAERPSFPAQPEIRPSHLPPRGERVEAGLKRLGSQIKDAYHRLYQLSQEERWNFFYRHQEKIGALFDPNLSLPEGDVPDRWMHQVWQQYREQGYGDLEAKQALFVRMMEIMHVFEEINPRDGSVDSDAA